MQYSEVLVKILKRAGEVQEKAQAKAVSAPAILVAIAELCGTKYQGITNYYSEQYPVWYEEERLRYLYGKMFKASGNLVSYSLARRIKKDYLEYDVDFIEIQEKQLEAMRTERNVPVLTSDIVFLLALDSIKDRQRMGLLQPYQNEILIEELLDETDKCIYDYVISEIGKIQDQLQKKADEAKAKRDWKPAAKFAEPEELLEQFFKTVHVTKSEKSLELTFPFFYDGEREEKVTIIRIDEVYYVKSSRGKTGAFCQILTFTSYLQELILIDKSDSTGYVPCSDWVEVDWSKAENFDSESFLKELKQAIVARYDENAGLILSVAMLYPEHNTWASFLLETLEDGLIRISDNGKGYEKDENLEDFGVTGEILDGCYVPLLFKFINLAVISTELDKPIGTLEL